jgi:hypothetical protein
VDVVTRQVGGKKTREAFETDVWYKRDGKWKIVQHYNSKEVP